jgi:formylglycine-generating enzyme
MNAPKVLLLTFLFYSCTKWNLVEEEKIPYPEMVEVKGGSFQMGNNNYSDDERPVHLVVLDDFLIGKYEVTVKQYKDFCLATNRSFPANPIWSWKDNHPIVFVSWKDANDYCAWLSTLTGSHFRLPTEAEWEYAARGGAFSKDYKFAGSDVAEEVGWFGGNTYLISQETRPVGQKKPNELNIYDMSGNAWEWCSDWYGNYTLDQKNPKGPATGISKVMRGGSWFDFVIFLRTSGRYPFEPQGIYYQVGFRIVQER